MSKAKKSSTRGERLGGAKRQPGLSDDTANALAAQLQKAYSSAMVVPGMGLPSKNSGVATIVYPLNDKPTVTVDGLTSYNHFFNSGYMSLENTDGKWLNINTVALPTATADTYVSALKAAGISAQSTPYSPEITAVFSKSNTDPTTFVTNTIKALQQSLGTAPAAAQ